MNSQLREAVNVRNDFRRKFTRCNSSENWQKYHKQRNISSKLRKHSVQEYLKNKRKQEYTNGYEF